jgi:hypothetical protein
LPDNLLMNSSIPALHVYAGPTARAHIAAHGLRAQDIAAIPAAAGGPKGLVLGPLDRFVFGNWLAQSAQPVDLIGASIGAWRMATACLDVPRDALERLEHAYIHQDYVVEPGRKRPTARHISERFGAGLRAFYGDAVPQLLAHPRFRLHVVTAAFCATQVALPRRLVLQVLPDSIWPRDVPKACGWSGSCFRRNRVCRLPHTTTRHAKWH